MCFRNGRKELHKTLSLWLDEGVLLRAWYENLQDPPYFGRKGSLSLTSGDDSHKTATPFNELPCENIDKPEMSF